MKLYTKNPKPLKIILVLLISLTLTVVNSILFLIATELLEKLIYFSGTILFATLTINAHFWGQRYYNSLKNQKNN